MGGRPENPTGIDLLPDLHAEARRWNPERVSVRSENVAALAFLDATFNLVLQATVFTSVLDSAMKQRMPSEMLRVMEGNGLLLWYDYQVNNPWNPDVRGVKRQELYRLFPGCRIELQRITLAPPFRPFACPVFLVGLLLVTHEDLFRGPFPGEDDVQLPEGAHL